MLWGEVLLGDILGYSALFLSYVRALGVGLEVVGLERYYYIG